MTDVLDTVLEHLMAMLSPKRVKFRKMFKGRTRGLATRGNTVVNGHYGLQALEPGWVTQPADRGRACRADAAHQAGRQSVDPDFSRQADHQEAGRDPHGKGQGIAGGVGGGGEAWPRDVRAGGRDAGDRARRPWRWPRPSWACKTKFVAREEAHTDA